jgi:S1-C subfamily serine protease
MIRKFIRENKGTLALLALAFLGISQYQSSESRARSLIVNEGKSVVRVLNKEKNSGGTGFVVKSPTSGVSYVVTNNHVCEVGEDGYVTLNSTQLGRDMRARIIELSPGDDLCLIEAPAGLPSLKISGSNAGLLDQIYVVGHPQLMPLTVTTGLIRQLPRLWEIPTKQLKHDEKCEAGEREEMVFIFRFCIGSFYAYEMTAEIRPGNSGSPVMNSDGEVVAVVFAGGDGISLAITGRALLNFLSVR